MSAPDSLCESLRANADLTEKALDFISDPEGLAEAKQDIELWRAAADEIDRLHRTLQAIHRNSRSYHALEDGKQRALNVIGNWAEDALAGGLHESVEKVTRG